MIFRFSMPSILLVCASACSAADAPVSYRDLTGTWVVVGNDLKDPNADVQAYLYNDPSVVGARLILTPDRAYWVSKNETFDDDCRQPKLKKNESGFDLLCSGATKFGPPVTESNIDVKGKSSIILRWYDGLLLKLRKEK